MENDAALDFYKKKINITISQCDDVNILQYLESFCRLYIEKNKKEE